MAGNDKSKVERVALYARVSTEDQSERQTVQSQLEFLRDYCKLYSLSVEGEYVDDGWSGTVAIADRPEGRRLLDAAENKRFSTVIFYRLDRLGRKLAVILDAHEQLERRGVTLRSGTEPIDTSSPVGRFIFQLLGSIAELERATITERMTYGKNRVARTGRWTGGPIPYGYDLDENRCLIPSERWVPELGMTEADVVRGIFQRLADGSSINAETIRLNAARVAPTCRYAGGKDAAAAKAWGSTRIAGMIKNPLYMGQGTLESRVGTVERPGPALVTPEAWNRANRQTTANRSLSDRNSTRPYLLRRLVTCAICGRVMTGYTVTHKGTGRRSYYRCVPTAQRVQPDRLNRSHNKYVRAEWLEDLIWQDVRNFAMNPGEALADAQRQLREKFEQTSSVEAERHALLEQISQKDEERERVMTLFRRGRVGLAEAEAQLEDIEREAGMLKQMLAALRSQSDLVTAFENQLAQAAVMLAQLRERLDEIEHTGDANTKREIIRLLVLGIDVQPTDSGLKIVVRYAFSRPSVTETTTPSPAGR